MISISLFKLAADRFWAKQLRFKKKSFFDV